MLTSNKRNTASTETSDVITSRTNPSKTPQVTAWRKPVLRRPRFPYNPKRAGFNFFPRQ